MVASYRLLPLHSPAVGTKTMLILFLPLSAWYSFYYAIYSMFVETISDAKASVKQESPQKI
jgi:hypothetical protein